MRGCFVRGFQGGPLGGSRLTTFVAQDGQYYACLAGMCRSSVTSDASTATSLSHAADQRVFVLAHTRQMMPSVMILSDYTHIQSWLNLVVLAFTASWHAAEVLTKIPFSHCHTSTARLKLYVISLAVILDQQCLCLHILLEPVGC